MKSTKPVSVGGIVMYVPAKGQISAGNYDTSPLPAIIVAHWDETQLATYKNDEVNLKAFTDGPTDRWFTSVPHDQEAKAPGTWHWPEII